MSFADHAILAVGTLFLTRARYATQPAMVEYSTIGVKMVECRAACQENFNSTSQEIATGLAEAILTCQKLCPC
eukprot:949255-Amphidinium_carterae.1